MTKRTALYCRVSTADQTTQNQKRDLTRYCESRGFTVSHVFEDNGISGAKSSRPGLDALMLAAEEGQFDTVLVWKFDRFARSTSHLLGALNTFKDLGIDFVSYSEGIDTSTSVGKMVFTFLGGIAEFERNLIIERTQAGLRRAKANGAKFGRPKADFDVSLAFSLKQSGKSLRQISQEVGVSRTTLSRLFTKFTPVVA